VHRKRTSAISFPWKRLPRSRPYLGKKRGSGDYIWTCPTEAGKKFSIPPLVPFTIHTHQKSLPRSLSFASRRRKRWAPSLKSSDWACRFYFSFW
jgi:hypothetical protein